MAGTTILSWCIIVQMSNYTKEVPLEERQPERRGERTTIQVSLTADDKRLLKKYAAERGTTVAAVVHEWISLHCQGVG